eukprot:5851975-Pleurochrysis_carterae.AAC.1
MESNNPPLRSVALIAWQSEICPSIISGELQYAHDVAVNREHALILGRYCLISHSFYGPGK